MFAESFLRSDSAADEQKIDDCFAQRHSLEIALCLRSLVTRGDFLMVDFDGRQFVTQLLDVDSRRAHFVFDCSGARYDNHIIAQANKLTFRSQPAGIRTEFATSHPNLTMFEGRPAFEAPFPRLLHYEQRREFYRVDTPMFDPFIANGIDDEGVPFNLEIQDLSLGGVALRAHDARFGHVANGAIWSGVNMQLGKLGAVTADVECIASRQMLTPTGERRAVLGCRFVALRGNAERTLQRAITQLELRRQSRTARF